MAQDNLLSRLLAQREWLLADGATGTTLFKMGLESGDAPELWNESEVDKIRTLHNGFVDAGSDIILTNSFGGSSYRLMLHKAQKRVHELNKKAAQIACECVARVERPVVVAGSIGPTGELLVPVGELSYEDAVKAFLEQGEALLEGGVDVLWAETISAEEEMAAIAEAARTLNAPWCGTMSFDTVGRTMMGVTAERFAAFMQELPNPPVAYGANCGGGIADMAYTVSKLTAAAPDSIIIAKGNAGIPKYIDGEIHYDGTLDIMNSYAQLALNSGAKIIGGCCGTEAHHLTSMKEHLAQAIKLAPPTVEEIENILGNVSKPDTGISEDSGGRRSRRRSSH